MARFAVSFKVGFGKAGFGGFAGQGVNTMIHNMLRKEQKIGLKTLERAGAFCRGAARRPMRAGRIRKKRVAQIARKVKRRTRSKDGMIRHATKMERTRSKPGTAPHNHRGKQWGLKWIRFVSNKKNAVKVGPQKGTMSKAWRTKFDVDTMMERGGSGQFLAPLHLPEGEEGFRQWQNISQRGAKWPTGFVTGRYPKRSFMGPAADATQRKFKSIYISTRKSQL